MRLTRYIKSNQIKLNLDTRSTHDIPEGMTLNRYISDIKEAVLHEICDLLESSGNIVNPKKLYTDLWNREKKATTAIGEGIAIPHVRTMQARRFTMAFARAPEGIEFDAIDGNPVYFFFAVVAPPYDDEIYLKVYKEIGTIFGSEKKRNALMHAETHDEVVRILSEFHSG